MGLVLTVGHPLDLLEEEFASRAVDALLAALGDGLPLGPRDRAFTSHELLGGEMGWNWWRALQQRAAETLGQGAVPHLLSVDAWCGVYLDARTEPTAVWPDGPRQEQEPAPEPTVVTADGSDDEEISDEIRALMDQMTADFGPRGGQESALQVGDLAALKAELDALASALGYEPSEQALRSLSESYSTDDSRIDEDPDIQALCHAWITATRALEAGSPMWIVK